MNALGRWLTIRVGIVLAACASASADIATSDRASAHAKDSEIPVVRHQKIRGSGYLSNWTHTPQNWTMKPVIYGKCSTNLTDAEMLPRGTLCPDECMFVQEIQGDPCNQLCVPASACEATHPGLQWANPDSGLCEKPCGLNEEIPGCQTCAGHGRCGECYKNFLLLDNGRRCEYVGAHYFKYVWITIILILLAIMVYLIALFTRPKINTEVKRQALRHRALCRVARHGRGEDGDSIWEPWKLNTSLSSEDVAGRGVALYFRWMCFLAIVALAIVAGTAIVYETSGYARQAPTDGKITTAQCPDSLDPSDATLSKPKVDVFLQKTQLLEHWGENLEASKVTSMHRPKNHKHHHLHDSQQLRHAVNVEDEVDLRDPIDPVTIPVEHFSHPKHKHHKYHKSERLQNAVKVEGKRDPLDPISIGSVEPRASSVQYRHFSQAESEILPGDLEEDIEDTIQPLTKTVPKKHAAHKTYEDHHYRMFVFYSCLYVCVFVSTFVFIRWQFKVSNSWGNGAVGHSPYTLWVSGLPRELTCPTPLHSYLQQVLRAQGRPELGSVVGVSLAYDSSGYNEHIEEAISYWIHSLESKYASQVRIVPNEQGQPDSAMPPNRSSSSHHPFTPPYPRGDVSDGAGSSNQKPAQFEFGFVDALILGEPVPTKMQRTAPDTSWLREVTCSGDAFVVLDTQEACLLLEECFKNNRMISQSFFFNERRYDLQVRAIGQTEPLEILWKGFHREALVRQVLRMAACVCLIILAIVVFLLLYIPYAMYYNGLIEVPGVHVHFMHDLILGMLIGVGNAIVGKIIDIAANTASFRTKDGRDVTITTLSFFATFVNVMTDLLMTAVIVKGLALNNAFEGNSTGHDRLLAQSLFYLIVPGYLFVPLVLVPFFQNFLPFYLGSAVVGTRNVPKALAEKALEPPEFDMCWRYSDTLNNFCITLTLALLMSPYSWKVAACLLAFILLVMLIDRYLLLRHTRATAYTTHTLSLTFSVLWSVPMGGLAVLVAWWGFKAGQYTQSSPLFVAGMCLSLHFFLYGSFLYGLWHIYLRNGETTSVRYTDTYVLKMKEGKPWTYFNTNHVFCLRSLLLPAHESGWDVIKLRHANYPRQESGCIPFVCGKQHLQPGTAKNISEDLTVNVSEQVQGRLEEAAAYQSELIAARRQEFESALAARRHEAQDAVQQLREQAANAAARAEELRAAGASRVIAAVQGGAAAVRSRWPGSTHTPESSTRPTLE